MNMKFILRDFVLSSKFIILNYECKLVHFNPCELKFELAPLKCEIAKHCKQQDLHTVSFGLVSQAEAMEQKEKEKKVKDKKRPTQKGGKNDF